MSSDNRTVYMSESYNGLFGNGIVDESFVRDVAYQTVVTCLPFLIGMAGIWMIRDVEGLVGGMLFSFILTCSVVSLVIVMNRQKRREL